MITVQIEDQECFVDEIDSDLVSFELRLRKNKRTIGKYVAIANFAPKVYEKLLHRAIMERVLDRKLETHEQIDHKDRNGLNNTRANLRIATQSQNSANSKVRSTNKLGVKGVYQQDGRYRANITVNGKRHDLGMFVTLEEARAAYMEAAKKYFGEFARGE